MSKCKDDAGLVKPRETHTLDSLEKAKQEERSRELNAINFIPDWNNLWDAAEAKEEIGLDITGPGWYLSATDSILVIRVDDKTYRVFVWNHAKAGEAFNWIVNAPVRSDKR